MIACARGSASNRSVTPLLFFWPQYADGGAVSYQARWLQDSIFRLRGGAEAPEEKAAISSQDAVHPQSERATANRKDNNFTLQVAGGWK